MDDASGGHANVLFFRRQICGPCKRFRNEDKTGVRFCTVCEIHLCHSCETEHKTWVGLKDHKLVDSKMLPKLKTPSNEETCLKHPDKRVKYYCKTHETCFCSICDRVEHKRCSVECIDDLAKDYEKSNEYRVLVKDMKDLTERLKKTKSESNKSKQHYEGICEDFENDVINFKRKIDYLIDSLIEASLGDMKCMLDSEIKKSDVVTERCESRIAELSELRKRMEGQTKIMSFRELVISSKKAKALVKTYTQEIKKCPVQNELKDIRFQPNEEILTLLRNIMSIGTIVDESSDISQCVDGQIGNQGAKKTTQITGAKKKTQIHEPPRGASYIGKINVNQPDDNVDCCITGGALVGNNKLALADHANACVKIVDISHNKMVARVKLQKDPWSLTCSNSNEIVVTRDGGKLVFLRLAGIWSILKSLNVRGDCRGIVYSNNTLIVTFISPEPSVKVIDMNGFILKTFLTNEKGHMLFSSPVCIAISSDERTVFVSDEENNTVTCLNCNGTVKDVYTDPNLECPKSIDVSGNGIIFIANSTSHNIYKLCTACYHGEVVIGRHPALNRPLMVIYSESENKLYISHYHKDSNETVVSVLKLQ